MSNFPYHASYQYFSTRNLTPVACGVGPISAPAAPRLASSPTPNSAGIQTQPAALRRSSSYIMTSCIRGNPREENVTSTPRLTRAAYKRHGDAGRGAAGVRSSKRRRPSPSRMQKRMLRIMKSPVALPGSHLENVRGGPEMLGQGSRPRQKAPFCLKPISQRRKNA